MYFCVVRGFRGFPKIGVPVFGGVPLRGFYSIWGIKGGTPIFRNNHFITEWHGTKARKTGSLVKHDVMFQVFKDCGVRCTGTT